jgi:hypothetical protein
MPTKPSIPREIDELLWVAAESHDPRARAEFERRYPQYRALLATRIAMVEVMRSSRPQATIPPTFRPPLAMPSRLWLVPATAVLLAALAFGAYRLGLGAFGNPQPAPSPEVAVTGPAPQPAPKVGPKALVQPRPDDGAGTSPRPAPTVAEPVVVLKAGKATLYGALEALQSQGKLNIQVLPGVEDANLALQPNRPDGSIALHPNDLLRLLEQAAAIRIIDNGPEGYLVLPLDKVRNVEPLEGDPMKSKGGQPQ